MGLRPPPRPRRRRETVQTLTARGTGESGENAAVPSVRRVNPIPPARRTRPLGAAEAARLMGFKGKGKSITKILLREVQTGRIIRHELSRKMAIYDINDF